MKRYIFIILIISSVSPLLGQVEINGVPLSNDALLFNNLPGKLVELKRTSVSIEIVDNNLKNQNFLGSGFLAIKKNIHYAITNSHVIRNIPLKFNLVVGINFENQKQYALIDSIIEDKKNDIAVLRISQIVSNNNKPIIDTTLFKPKFNGISMFAKNDEIIEGVGVILIGYPLGIGSEFGGNRPISRIGIIAQRVNPNTKTFYIDGVASHGNSGSPVYDAQNMKLLGMIVGFPSDFISAFDENGLKVAQLPYNSGLSLCISIEMINKIIP